MKFIKWLLYKISVFMELIGLKKKVNHTLYVIGNGFDRHHGMRTGYYDFAKYLKANDEQLYKDLERLINFPDDDDSLWNRFEENLANLDVESLLQENSFHIPDVLSDSFKSSDNHAFADVMIDELRKFTTELVQIFQKFIIDVKIPNSAIERIVEIDSSAFYFSFNYTSTLETLYNIDSKNILYIHNRANSRYDEIVLGHGVNPEKLKREDEKPPDGLSEKEIKEWYEQYYGDYDYPYDAGKETIYSYFDRSFKPTQKIIKENIEFFEQLKTMNNIFVLGHSLSDVDLPYFEEIIKKIDSEVTWIVSFHSATDKVLFKDILRGLGVNEQNITMITLEGLQATNNQLELDI